MNDAHIYAPKARSQAIVDFDCPVRAGGERRRCGSYHAVVRFYDWHDPVVHCCGCGYSWGTCRLRTKQLKRLRAEHAELVAAGAMAEPRED